MSSRAGLGGMRRQREAMASSSTSTPPETRPVGETGDVRSRVGGVNGWGHETAQILPPNNVTSAKLLHLCRQRFSLILVSLEDLLCLMARLILVCHSLIHLPPCKPAP